LHFGLQKNTKISEAAEDNTGSAGILPACLLFQDSQRDAGAARIMVFRELGLA
jgi:hypothetical protein